MQNWNYGNVECGNHTHSGLKFTIADVIVGELRIRRILIDIVNGVGHPGLVRTFRDLIFRGLNGVFLACEIKNFKNVVRKLETAIQIVPKVRFLGPI